MMNVANCLRDTCLNTGFNTQIKAAFNRCLFCSLRGKQNKQEIQLSV